MSVFLMEFGEEIGITEIHKLRNEMTKIGRNDQLKILLHEKIQDQEQLAIEVLKEHEFSIDYKKEHKNFFFNSPKKREGLYR